MKTSASVSPVDEPVLTSNPVDPVEPPVVSAAVVDAAVVGVPVDDATPVVVDAAPVSSTPGPTGPHATTPTSDTTKIDENP